MEVLTFFEGSLLLRGPVASSLRAFTLLLALRFQQLFVRQAQVVLRISDGPQRSLFIRMAHQEALQLLLRQHLAVPNHVPISGAPHLLPSAACAAVSW
eukprot:scaffold7780_cov267-Pinguiococcus_pyrenoidosus.AAC.1